MHGEFLTVGEQKMAKSTGNVMRVAELPAKGFEPLAFRYLALTAHYRSKLDFTQDAMHAAAAGLARLRRAASVAAASDAAGVDLAAEPAAGYRARFAEAMADDLATPRALAIAHEIAAAADLGPVEKRALLLDLDRVLGLDVTATDPTVGRELPPRAAELLDRRAAARAARDFAASDALRDELALLGVEVRDTPNGQETTIR